MTRRAARRQAAVRHLPVFEVTWSDLKHGDRIEHFEYGSGTVNGSGPIWIDITWDDVALRALSSHSSAITKYLRRIHPVSD